MRVFLDTEFTDFINMDLISLGMVSESGETFYAEHQGYERSWCSDFVKQVVIPLLGKDPKAQYATLTRIRDEVLAYLEKWKDEGVIISVDYAGDWNLFLDVLGDRLPEWVKGELIRHQLDDVAVRQYYELTGLSNHHALNDALANKMGWRPPPPDQE